MLIKPSLQQPQPLCQVSVAIGGPSNKSKTTVQIPGDLLNGFEQPEIDVAASTDFAPSAKSDHSTAQPLLH